MNLVDWHRALKVTPVHGLDLTLDWDFFGRESLRDGLYGPSTALLVPGAGNSARYIGSQGAALVQWQGTQHLAINGSYSPFFAGPFLRVTGPGKDVDFVALWVSYAI